MNTLVLKCINCNEILPDSTPDHHGQFNTGLCYDCYQDQPNNRRSFQFDQYKTQQGYDQLITKQKIVCFRISQKRWGNQN